MNNLIMRIVLIGIILSVCPFTAGADENLVSIVTDKTVAPPVQHGLNKTLAQLKAKGLKTEVVTSIDNAAGNQMIVAGIINSGGPSSNLNKRLRIAAPEGPEALSIHRTRYTDKELILVTGSDERGLMYGLLDIADRIGWSKDAKNPFEKVKNIAEKPEVVERSLSIYTMNKAVFEEFFYDESYWAEYLDMMAANRFNTFALLFGYENSGYFSPPYPQFFDVDEFGKIKVIGVTSKRQKRNVKALKKIIQMTHDRGMNFTLGIWDHIYRGGVQGPKERAGKPTPDVIWGLNSENIFSYTKAALSKFVRMFPEIDAIQFRMHGESGLKRGEMDKFWTMVYQVMLDDAPKMRFDARAKNFPHHLIDKAIDMGVDMRICTKYWMEQMGMPFHPTHIPSQNQHDRRHGYADMLRYPKRYDMHWRLWNSGTTRVLQWGDPDYVRRFVASTHLYDGKGFEVSEPMTTKMQSHPHDGEVFDLLTEKYKYYKWEFQRYWYFHQLFGRLGYNPNTPPKVWQSQFQKRFGPAATHVEKGMDLASKVLPRIVSYCHPYRHFPTTRGWAERQRQGDLPAYAMVKGTDTQQFLSPQDAAGCILNGTDSAKMRPEESSRWFAKISEKIRRHVDGAERLIGQNKSKEFISTMTDLKILSHLAAYHSYRSNAGLWYALFKQSADLNAFDEAINYERKAVKSWGKLVEAAGDVFTFDMRMGRRGSSLSGHWRDELAALELGLEKLTEQRKQLTPKLNGSKPNILHVPVRKIAARQNLTIKATIAGDSPIRKVRLFYKNSKGGYKSLKMKKTAPFLYQAVMKAKSIKGNLDYYIEATDSKKQISIWPENGKNKPLNVIVTDDHQAPKLLHTPIINALPQKDLKITAQVSDSSQVKWVRVRYRSVNQFFDYKTVTMQSTGNSGQYQAVIDAEDIPYKWDFMYFFEVMDSAGNGKIYPNLENQAPYIIVELQR
ncbi:MAG: hypothetical protein FVQ82_15820 [Planctomycetes bacterium]|nr:hypothetical protein [Planctomycetota bacterium]